MMTISSRSASLKVWKLAMIEFRVIRVSLPLQLLDQGDSMGGNAQALAGKAQMLLCGGLDAHSIPKAAARFSRMAGM